MQSNIVSIARKEVAAFFASPVAFIFLFTFLAVNLFVFFWVEAFFARNIADIRPLFEWMPLLLIFLVAALTMRMWSEEIRSGTVELLLTVPVSPLRLVLGKYLACLFLVFVALLLTSPIPLTAAALGNLDWGPVFGGYIATLFLAGAYIAIGLYVSSRSDNQIVSLILTVLICSIFFLLGSDALTGLLGTRGAEFLQLLGSGSRFDSITRGIIDVRDIYYYLSLIGVFTALNVYTLQSMKWAKESSKPSHIRLYLTTVLLAANFIAANLWLHHVRALRIDLTRGKIYSISPATESLLAQLQEPLLIRGYFSSKTHPLLSPLVPRIRDLIKEYAIAGDGSVRAEVIDPREHPDLEEEANRRYGIKSVPFQVSDKYQASLVNSYFDILIKYGDKYETLGFRDLIEVKVQSEDNIDVKLRNPEYDITRAVKKVLYGFQSTETLFASLTAPITFRGYITPNNKLPDRLAEFKGVLEETLDELRESAGGKLNVIIQDPRSGTGDVAKEIAEQYGFHPMMAGLFSSETFYFYMLLDDGQRVEQIPLPENLEKEALKKGIEAALKRFSTGFLRTIGISTPPPAMQNPYMPSQQAPQRDFRMIRQKLSENYTLRTVDLKNGTVPEVVDLLLLIAPENFDEKQLFAVDQFLMKGGTVVAAESPFQISRTDAALTAAKKSSGLREWLGHYGIKVKEELVLDPQNEPYPVPVRRQVGAFAIEELHMIPYPFAVDIRAAGMSQDNAITSSIPQVTINWASPIEVDDAQVGSRSVTRLLWSSPASWTTDSTNVEPNLQIYPEHGFPQTGKQGSHLLALVMEGGFESYFKGRPSPLLREEPQEEDGTQEEPGKEEKAQGPAATSVIERSPESSRILLFASNEFLSDQTLRMSAGAGSDRFMNSLQIIENTIDWSLEDRALLSIRGRGHFSQTLRPLTEAQRVLWEYGNYAAAALLLLLAYILYRMRRAKTNLRYQEILRVGGTQQ